MLCIVFAAFCFRCYHKFLLSIQFVSTNEASIKVLTGGKVIGRKVGNVNGLKIGAGVTAESAANDCDRNGWNGLNAGDC